MKDKIDELKERIIMLPKPSGKYGYTECDIYKLCEAKSIPPEKFWQAFGVNTITQHEGKSNYYECDVERALHKLGDKDGKFHMWD